MKRFFLIFLWVGAISMLQAQSLQKTALKIDELKISTTFSGNYGDVYGFGSDEKNYYVYLERENSFFIVNKKFTPPAKKYPIKGEKGDIFLKILTTESDVMVLVARNKKSEHKMQIIKQLYAKTTGKLRDETVIASSAMSKSENWLFRSEISADKTKTGFLFMIASKKNTVDSYYAAVLNQDGGLEWDVTHDLEISNEAFSIQDLAVTNKGELYVALLSFPEKAKKAVDKKLYIDLLLLTDGTKDKMKIPIEKYAEGEVKLKILKSGNLCLAALFGVDEKSYKKEFFSLKISASTFNEAGSGKKEIEEKNTHLGLYMGGLAPSKLLYDLEIEKILELDNGDIAVVCEQGIAASYGTVAYQNGVANTAHAASMTVYYKIRGSVTTFFVKGEDASVVDVSVMDKYQLSRSQVDYDAKCFNLSIYPFVYGNKVGYIFNDCLKKYTTPAKYKKGTSFKNVDGKDACIVLNTQESGEKAKIALLSGNVAAGRLVRQILFEEEDKLIVLTQNKKGAYIETLTLP